MSNEINQPFESQGQYYTGYVSRVPNSTRRQRRRYLVFVTSNGIIGASADFNRAEAYTNALRAASGKLGLPHASLPADAMLTQILHARGVPVKSASDFVDDTTAALIANEFKCATSEKQ